MREVFHARVAQMVEQWSEKPRVVGSIPTLGAAEWSSLVARWAHNPKADGSNPSSATTHQTTSLGPHSEAGRNKEKEKGWQPKAKAL